MQIIVCPDPAAQARACASLIAAQVLQKPNSVLGLATGSSPIRTYQALIDLKEAGALDLSRVRTFNLDEYVGIPEAHPESYHAFMRRQLFDATGVRPAQTRIPNGNAADLEKECLQYEQEIEAAGGIDLQLLGLGHNGHIAFNEPSDQFPRFTNIVHLTQDTIDANQRFFASADEVPRQALTMGIGTIMRARSVVLVATGESKADIIHTAFEGAVTPQVPASILQFHPRCTVILDEAAASALTSR